MRDSRGPIFQSWGKTGEDASYVIHHPHDMTLNITVRHAPHILHYTSTFVLKNIIHYRTMHSMITNILMIYHLLFVFNDFISFLFIVYVMSIVYVSCVLSYLLFM